MFEKFELKEVLSDAEAYFSSGHVNEAVGILFEGLEMAPDSRAAERIYWMLRDICYSFWESGKFDEGTAVMRIVVHEALKAIDCQVEADCHDFYIKACVATGTAPFPIQRILRHQNLIRLFRTVIDEVQGDVVECGCNKGLSFLMLCLTFAKSHPEWMGEGFHIFDSFEGLSEPDEKDREFDPADGNAERVNKMMVAGNFACSLQVVSANVHRFFPRVQLHPGWIPDRFSEQEERIYRFVHLDVDLYQPTLDSLNYFFPRLAKGGIIITDDYAWPGAKKAFQEFCHDNGVDLQTTETSQAFLVKQ